MKKKLLVLLITLASTMMPNLANAIVIDVGVIGKKAGLNNEPRNSVATNSNDDVPVPDFFPLAEYVPLNSKSMPIDFY
jgi:uncharacterized protein related to proFAR isomerase